MKVIKRTDCYEAWLYCLIDFYANYRCTVHYREVWIRVSAPKPCDLLQLFSFFCSCVTFFTFVISKFCVIVLCWSKFDECDRSEWLCVATNKLVYYASARCYRFYDWFNRGRSATNQSLHAWAHALLVFSHKCVWNHFDIEYRLLNYSSHWLQKFDEISTKSCNENEIFILYISGAFVDESMKRQKD